MQNANMKLTQNAENHSLLSIGDIPAKFTVGNQNGSFQRKCALLVPFRASDGSFRRKMVGEEFEALETSKTDR